ncbi:integrase arm-type DNA-binding domain-containing protein [Defluviimonas sp. WL0050]|uniref:Integrase arm-type DNA-binding domain-containing protein n=1 Tax=Albidovulum litorale TaxID=2984134 RepID=A0ABT2ZKD6_9RHOB|nr:site-specific integrase [Defluviimonas sp. WL0050]MCV2871592.1 integrase arm-type DNA-binding domain-containing protein [Defluviimonas sp. WL0050]
MAKAFTTRGIEAIKPDPEKRQEIPDAGLSGLYLVVQPSGVKSWALRYRFGGKPSKLTLGRWPLMGVADARAAAADALEKIERGDDPATEKMATKAARKEAQLDERDKFANVVALFLKRHASRNRRADDVAAMFRREVIPQWGERKIGEITKRDVIDVLDGVVDRGSPVSANRLRAHLNTLFNWAKGRDIVQANPLDGIKPPSPEKARTRVLGDDEIRLFWKACDKLGQPFGPLFKLLLLTGQRRGEVGEMTEREISGEEWVIPAERAKNDDEHRVPLSQAVRDVLAGVERISGKAGLIFTTTGARPVSGFTRAKGRLDRLMVEIASEGQPEEIELPPFTLHDLRRTAATGMAGLGFPPHVVEAVLNHRSGTRRGVAGVYNRFDYADEKRRALEAWARFVVSLVEGSGDNVVRMEAGR